MKEISRLRNLRCLRISRATGLMPDDFCRAFKRENLKDLTDLDVSECVGFEDESLIAVAKRCTNMKKIRVDWCHDLTDEGVKFLIQNCHHLQCLNFVGLFKVTDAILENVPQLLPKLKHLNLTQCPGITDELLMGISLDNLHLDILDYYGNQVQEEVLEQQCIEMRALVNGIR